MQAHLTADPAKVASVTRLAKGSPIIDSTLADFQRTATLHGAFPIKPEKGEELAAEMREHMAEAQYEATVAAERANPTLKALREAYRFISQPASMSGSGPVCTITYRTGRFNELSAMLRKAIATAELGEVAS